MMNETQPTPRPSQPNSFAELLRQDLLFLPAALILLIGMIGLAIAPPPWMTRLPTAIAELVHGRQAMLTNQNDQLKNALAETETLLAETESAKADVEALANQREDDINVLSQDLDDRKNQIEQLVAENRENVRQRDHLKATTEALRENNVDLERDLKASNLANEKLEAEIQRVERRIEEQDATIGQRASIVSSLREELDTQNFEVASLQRDLTAAETEKLELTRKLDALSQEAGAVGEDANAKASIINDQALSLAASEQRITALEAELASLTDRERNLEASLSEAAKRIDGTDKVRLELEAELETKTAELSEQTSETEQLKSELEAARTDQVTLSEELDNLRQERNVVRQDATAKGLLVNRQRQALAEKEEAIQTLETKVGNLTQQQQDLTTNLSEVELRLREADQRRQEAEIELRDQGAELEATASRATGFAENMRSNIAEIDRLSTQVTTLNAERERLLQTARDLEHRLAEQTQQTAALKQATTDLDKQRAELETAKSARLLAERQSAAQTDEIQALERERTSLTSQIEGLETALETQNIEREKLIAGQRTISGEVIRLAGLLATADQSMRLQRDGIEETADQLMQMTRFRSEFFGRLRTLLGDRPDVQVVGDRFVFQAEILFDSGSATLGPEGLAQLDRLVEALQGIIGRIPPEIDWILRVDGHTDRQPIQNATYPSNWHLSSARAIAVVDHLTRIGIPANRLSANAFAENQPLYDQDDAISFERNRRIEFTLTQR